MKLRLLSDGDRVTVVGPSGEAVEGVRAVEVEWRYGQPVVARIEVVGPDGDFGFDADVPAPPIPARPYEPDRMP